MIAPDLAAFEAMAEAAWAALPETFRAHAADLIIRVEDFADEETLAELGIEDPFELSGLCHGVDLTRRSISDPNPSVPMVFLYRRAILDEWAARADVSLQELIAHVLVHEVGHHFGFSDAVMDAILEAVE